MQLVQLDETAQPPPHQDRRGEDVAYADYRDSLIERGAWIAGEALHRSDMTTTVRLREREVLTTDGPFAEVAEQVVGFYLIEAADLDEAIAIAAGVPGARYGSVEVRPVWDYAAEMGA